MRTSSIRFSIPKSVNAWTPVSPAPSPDNAILDLHLTGDAPQPVFVFAEVLGDTRDGGDVTDLVDMHSHAARAESAAVRDHDYLLVSTSPI